MIVVVLKLISNKYCNNFMIDDDDIYKRVISLNKIRFLQGYDKYIFLHLF